MHPLGYFVDSRMALKLVWPFR